MKEPDRWITTKQGNRVPIDDDINITDAIRAHYKGKRRIKMTRVEYNIVRSEINTYCNIYHNDEYKIGERYAKKIFIAPINKYYVYKFYIRDYNEYVITERLKVEDVER